MIHDPIFDKKPFPGPRVGYEFVGQVFDEHNQPVASHLERLKEFLQSHLEPVVDIVSEQPARVYDRATSSLLERDPQRKKVQMSSLRIYKKNIYSQNGEDGVLEEILRRLDLRTGSFVEFGAWDGKYLSNTYYLLEKGWSGVYIEGDKEKFQALVHNMERFSQHVELINAYVEPKGPHTLDKLLASTRIQREFEVLSIDIDSYDWQIWESIHNYNPTVVVIEINSSIPVGIYQTHRSKEIQGSSFSATVDLGLTKGYQAVCHTGNVVFVKSSLVPQLNLPEMEILFPETLFDYSLKRLSYEAPMSPRITLEDSATLLTT
jgi:hypothetical protein